MGVKSIFQTLDLCLSEADGRQLNFEKELQYIRSALALNIFKSAGYQIKSAIEPRRPSHEATRLTTPAHVGWNLICDFTEVKTLSNIFLVGENSKATRLFQNYQKSAKYKK